MKKETTTPQPDSTIEGLQDKHTEWELWRDDDGFIAIGHGDNYHTFADLDCSDLDISEREANKDRLIMCWNNYQSLLDENQRLRAVNREICHELQIFIDQHFAENGTLTGHLYEGIKKIINNKQLKK
ncbi:MAG: hypothetical protein V4547_18775 [Bacteroidota bacterium]